MKKKCIIVLVSILIIELIFIFYQDFIYKSRDAKNLKLWMSYEEVLKAFPHNRNDLMRGDLADEYKMNDEEKKCLPNYHVDLEVKYGLILGFNEIFELVFINHIKHARMPQPVVSIPDILDKNNLQEQ